MHGIEWSILPHYHNPQAGICLHLHLGSRKGQQEPQQGPTSPLHWGGTVTNLSQHSNTFLDTKRQRPGTCQPSAQSSISWIRSIPFQGAFHFFGASSCVSFPGIWISLLPWPVRSLAGSSSSSFCLAFLIPFVALLVPATAFSFAIVATPPAACRDALRLLDELLVPLGLQHGGYWSRLNRLERVELQLAGRGPVAFCQGRMHGHKTPCQSVGSFGQAASSQEVYGLP